MGNLTKTLENVELLTDRERDSEAHSDEIRRHVSRRRSGIRTRLPDRIQPSRGMSGSDRFGYDEGDGCSFARFRDRKKRRLSRGIRVA